MSASPESQQMVLAADGSIQMVSAAEADKLREAAARQKLADLQAQVGASQSLPPEMFPRDKFPSLYEERPSTPLTPEQIAKMKQRAAEQQANFEALLNSRRRKSRLGSQADMSTVALYDETQETSPSELRMAFERAVIMLRIIGDRANENAGEATSALLGLIDQMQLILEEFDWEPKPLH